MTDTTWLEVSLVVDGEMAEAVAEVLARFARNGVAIESTAVTANPDDSEGHAVGPLRVYGYLRMDENLEENRRRLEEALWYLGRIRPLPAAEFRPIHETNWAEAWKQHYHPIAIGRKLMIVPAWEENPDFTRQPIRIDPGMAFGTGTHPTTQLCLELIEAILTSAQGNPPRSVIDVGCGSGILSIAALLMGADHALGVDIDPDCISATRENADLNNVAGRLEFGLGSVAEVKAGAYSLNQAPLVLANILAPVIIRLFADGLGDLVSPGGSLVLSGILDQQAPAVLEAATQHGLRLVDQRLINDWAALWLERPAG